MEAEGVLRNPEKPQGDKRNHKDGFHLRILNSTAQ